MGHTAVQSVEIHVKWGPCQHGMARTQVADGGDGLRTWRVAASILNKQSRRVDKGWFSSLGLRSGNRKKKMLRNVTKGLELGRIHF
jgi:hypothetical protein